MRPTPALRVVVAGDRVWLSVRTPAFTRPLGPGRRWVETSLAGVRATAGLVPTDGLPDLALLESLRGFADARTIPSTLSLLGALRGARGLRPISGGYAFTVNRGLALARAPVAQRAALARDLDLGGLTKFVITGTAHISPADGRVRAMTLRLRSSDPRRARAEKNVALALSALDAPLSISPPPATQTEAVSPSRLQQILDQTGAALGP